MSKTKGYIFDYGGTLDTGGNHWGKVIWHAYERQGIPVGESLFREAYVYAERMLACQPIIRPDFTFRQTLEAKLRLQLEFLSEKPDSPLFNSQFSISNSQFSILNDLYTRTKAATAHSRKVLLQLHESCPMVLVSNFYGNLSVVLREFGFSECFDAVIESAVVGVRKPDPRIFMLGIERLGLLPEEVTVVGDSFDKDILPAIEIGCRAIWLKEEGWI